MSSSEEQPPTKPTVALPRPPRPVDSSAETQPAAGARLGDETEPGSLHARVTRGLDRGAAVDRYLVLAELGRGGMGVVYAAYDPDLDRRIAIKVLRGRSDEGSAGSQRLLREAQALAKLSHPNVIGVYDVGTVGDEVFVAMELVQGGTMREHVAGKSWREQLEAYVAAGRGLAAAHAAGLVHRDFKPENVLVGPDGRPRVTDFGLVRATAVAGDGGGSTEPEPSRERPPQPLPLDSSLTAAGTVMGTPSYMAPEQMVGEATSAATDQYSFAVALWEALFDAKPYTGKDIAAVRAAIEAGRKTAYDRGEVPVRVVRALERSLALAPADRWPSMDALLAELDAGARPGARRRAAAVLVIGGLLVLAVGGVYALGTRRDECARAGDPAADLWTRAPITAAFQRTAPGFADEAVRMVENRVAVWRDDWQRRARAACSATRVQRTQSDQVLDQRMSCLRRKLDAARALIAGLAAGDRATVERAGDAMGGLPELADCDDVAVLTGMQAMPSERAARATIEALGKRLDELHGRRSTTFAADARAALRADVAEAVTAAEATRYFPLIAQARLIEGALAGDLADGPGARAALLAAAAAAIRGGDDATLADAYLQLGGVATYLIVDFPAARAWLELAGAVIDGLREPGHRKALLDERRSDLAHAEGDLPGARAAIDRALAAPGLGDGDRFRLTAKRVDIDFDRGEYAAAERDVAELLPRATELLGTAHPRRAGLIQTAGRVAYQRGQYARAAELQREALGLKEAAYGPRAPALITSLQALGISENVQGNVDESRALIERAITIARASYGGEHVEVAGLLSDLAGTYARAKDYRRELAINREVLAIRRKVLGPDHPETAMTMVNVGIAAKNLGRQTRDRGLFAEAIANQEKARAIYAETYGPDHFNVGAVDDNLGWSLSAAGRHADAIEAFARAEATFAKATSTEHPVIADALTGRALSALSLARAAEAVELLERAVKLRDAPDLDPADLADSRFALARALRATGGDPARSRALAEQALAVWKDRGAGYAELVAEAERFLGATPALAPPPVTP
jgi:tetratricopeptide (TPR) repeat protein